MGVVLLILDEIAGGVIVGAILIGFAWLAIFVVDGFCKLFRVLVPLKLPKWIESTIGLILFGMIFLPLMILGIKLIIADPFFIVLEHIFPSFTSYYRVVDGEKVPVPEVHFRATWIFAGIYAFFLSLGLSQTFTMLYTSLIQVAGTLGLIKTYYESYKWAKRKIRSFKGEKGSARLPTEVHDDGTNQAGRQAAAADGAEGPAGGQEGPDQLQRFPG